MLARQHVGRSDGEVIAEEKFGWFAAPSWQHRADEPLPLATMPEPCGVRASCRAASRCCGRALDRDFCGRGSCRGLCGRDGGTRGRCFGSPDVAFWRGRRRLQARASRAGTAASSAPLQGQGRTAARRACRPVCCLQERGAGLTNRRRILKSAPEKRRGPTSSGYGHSRFMKGHSRAIFTAGGKASEAGLVSQPLRRRTATPSVTPSARPKIRRCVRRAERTTASGMVHWRSTAAFPHDQARASRVHPVTPEVRGGGPRPPRH